jgi:PAS domain S-box-containing protein
VTRNPQLAAWLVSRRAEIERTLVARLGPAAPRAGADETEVLRRFRSYAALSLQRGVAAQPALDGLRANERRVSALLAAWFEAASEVAGNEGDGLRQALDPLLSSFHAALRTTTSGRRKRGAPRTRRAVSAAIDRVADAFLAVDAENGDVVDANPAAGALLGVARDALLGVDAMSFVSEPDRAAWWTELDAVTEASEPRRFRAALRDVQGGQVPVDCTVTRFSTRQRTLALIVARPAHGVGV